MQGYMYGLSNFIPLLKAFFRKSDCWNGLTFYIQYLDLPKYTRTKPVVNSMSSFFFFWFEK